MPSSYIFVIVLQHHSFCSVQASVQAKPVALLLTLQVQKLGRGKLQLAVGPSWTFKGDKSESTSLPLQMKVYAICTTYDSFNYIASYSSYQVGTRGTVEQWE